MHDELCKGYNEKVCRVTEQRHRGDSCHSRQGSKCSRTTMTTVIMTTTTKATRDGKTKPLLIAATRRSCHAWCMGRRASTPPRSATRTPRTANINLKTKKRHYNAHHNNAHYTSDDDESHLSTDTLVPSEDPASASSKSEKTHEDENHHLHVAKKMKAGSHVPCKSDH